MKNVLIISILAFILFARLQASSNSVHIAVNSSSFTDTHAMPLTGIAMGYAHEWRISERWAIQTGIEYLSKGAKLANKVIYTFDSEWATMNDIYIRMGYISADISIKWFIPSEKKIYFLLGLCPSLAIQDQSKKELLNRWNKWNYFPDQQFPPVDVDYASSYEFGHLSIINSSTVLAKTGFGVRYNMIGVELNLSYDFLGGLGPVDGIAPSYHKFVSGTLAVLLFF